jgi:hypothetical protein
MSENTKKVEIGMLSRSGDTWEFIWGTRNKTVAYFDAHFSLFAVLQELAREGWEPAFSEKSNYYFKRVF